MSLSAEVIELYLKENLTKENSRTTQKKANISEGRFAKSLKEFPKIETYLRDNCKQNS